LGSQTSRGMSGIMQNMQNIIVAMICLLMFWIMIVEIYRTSLTILNVKNFKEVAGHLIYIFVLIELFRLMIHYLEEQHIIIGSIIEVAIVSLLREVILEGALTIPWDRLLGICGLILTLTLTLVISHKIDAEREKLEQITLHKSSKNT